MENILFGNYNNYYNRKLKRLNTWSEYDNAFNMSGYDLPNYNFNPGNGLETKIVVGTTIEDMQFSTTSGPDYLIVYNESKDILSRWFIIDTNRTRGGQYELTLKRDVLADFLYYIEQSPIYIEKGVIEDVESPLLRNNEGLVVNQIKKDEVLLKDRTKCPWLVMYIKKGVLGSGSSVGPNHDGIVPINVGNNQGDVYETLSTVIGQWNMYTYTSNDFNVLDLYSFKVNWKKSSSGTDYYTYSFNATESNNKYVASLDSSHTNLIRSAGYDATAFNNNFKANFSALKTKLTNDLSLKNYNDIAKYDGKIIKDSDGKYYQCTVYKNTYFPIPTSYIANNNAPTTKSQMQTYWNTMMSASDTANDKAFAFSGILNGYRLTITEIPSLDVRIDFNNYTGQGATDCPLYDVLAMPYGTVES